MKNERKENKRNKNKKKKGDDKKRFRNIDQNIEHLFLHSQIFV